ncbi:hypothetical protein WLZ34_03925 [Thermogladius sp. KZ2Tp1]|uniref:hypothetical protein n=1 Tax=Thermogladius sp. KZ2Tp1 TaxID=3136289 RepID=UPI003DA956B0
MIIILNLLAFGLVVGDQPRLEFSIGSLMVSGKITSLEEASALSGYFNWPSTWLLEGIFSNIVGMTSFDAPVLLMVANYLLLGLAILTASQKILPMRAQNIALASIIAYATIDPYKILHFCPQIYALTLFLLFISTLLKNQLAVRDLITLLILSVTIITSHPLTSLIVVSVMSAMMLFVLIKRSRELLGLPLLSISVIILFIVWNLNFESLIRSVLVELLGEAKLQSLPPVATVLIYDVDLFYKAMAIYRYISLFMLGLFTLIYVIAMVKSRDSLKNRVLIIMAGALVGSLPLNFIPGSFLHRLLYFTSTIMVMLVPASIASLSRIFVKNVTPRMRFFIKSSMLLLLIIVPYLSHIALLEFLTNNNPVTIVHSTNEIITAAFMAKYYEMHQCIGSPSGSIHFAFMELRHAIPFCTYLIGGQASLNAYLLSKGFVKEFVEKVYNGVYVESPLEKYIVYHNTLFLDFNSVESILNSKSDIVYDSGLFKIRVNI